jgi:hypothetical protein
MKVICSWCEAEGKPEVVREKEPLEDPEQTHGVCPEHKALLNEPNRPSVTSEVTRGTEG